MISYNFTGDHTQVVVTDRTTGKTLKLSCDLGQWLAGLRAHELNGASLTEAFSFLPSLEVVFLSGSITDDEFAQLARVGSPGTF